MDHAQVHYSKHYPLGSIWKVIFEFKSMDKIVAHLIVFKDPSGHSRFEVVNSSEYEEDKIAAFENPLGDLEAQLEYVLSGTL